MKFGLPFGALNPKSWLDVAEAADEVGVESIWIPEHLVLPVAAEGSPFAGSDHPPIPAQTPVFDAFAYLAFLAGRTRTVKLGTHVYNIGLRHPFISARGAATVDVLSEGRLLLGVGASWLRQEWDAVGLDFDGRGARVDEAIEVCRRLWTEDVVEHHGRFFDFEPVAFEPKPVQADGPALHIGGDGRAALRRAATVGAGWIPMNHGLDELGPARDRIRQLADASGRTSPVEITLGGNIERPEDIEPYIAAGVDRIIVRPWQRSRGAADDVRAFAERVIRPLAGSSS